MSEKCCATCESYARCVKEDKVSDDDWCCFWKADAVLRCVNFNDDMRVEKRISKIIKAILYAYYLFGFVAYVSFAGVLIALFYFYFKS
jgi:hypothetical protein